MSSTWLFILSLTYFLVACNPAPPIVATVGPYTINTTDLRIHVEQLPAKHYIAATDSIVQNQYLQILIDHYLLLLEAHKRGLDTTKVVREAWQKTTDSKARNQILLDALKRSVVNPSDPIEEEEVQRYYYAHPELFYDESTQGVQAYTAAAPRALSLVMAVRQETRLYLLRLETRQKYHDQIRIHQNHLANTLTPSLLQIKAQEKGIQLSKRGGAYLQQGRLNKALNSLRKSIRYAPDLAQTHFYQGLTLARLNKTEEAIKAFELAIQLNPDQADYHYALGTSHQAQHHYLEAVNHFQQAIKQDPAKSHYHFRLGEAQRSLAAFTEALNAYTATLNLQPDHRDALFRHSDLLERIDSLAAATSGFKRLSMLEPNNTAVLINLARIHTKKKHHEKTVALLKKVIELQPFNANAYYLLSQSHARLNQVIEADAALVIFQRLSTAERYYTQGVKNATNRYWDRASALFQRAIQTDSTYVDAYIRLAMVELYRQAPEKSIPLLQQAIAIEPKNTESHCLLGEAYMVQDHPITALPFFITAITLDSTSVRAHYGYAKATFSSDDLANSAHAFNKILTIDPDHRDSHYYLGLIFMQQGKPRQAAQYFQDCLDINPQDTQAHHTLAQLLKRYGARDKARQAFKKILEYDPTNKKALQQLMQLEQSQ